MANVTIQKLYDACGDNEACSVAVDELFASPACKGKTESVCEVDTADYAGNAGVDNYVKVNGLPAETKKAPAEKKEEAKAEEKTAAGAQMVSKKDLFEACEKGDYDCSTQVGTEISKLTADKNGKVDVSQSPFLKELVKTETSPNSSSPHSFVIGVNAGGSLLDADDYKVQSGIAAFVGLDLGYEYRVTSNPVHNFSLAARAGFRLSIPKDREDSDGVAIPEPFGFDVFATLMGMYSAQVSESAAILFGLGVDAGWAFTEGDKEYDTHGGSTGFNHMLVGLRAEFGVQIGEYLRLLGFVVAKPWAKGSPVNSNSIDGKSRLGAPVVAGAGAQVRF